MPTDSLATLSEPPFDVILSNVVILPTGLSITGTELQQRLKSPKLSKLVGRSAAITQGLVADLERGPMVSFTVEGIHGQRAVSVSAVRVEATDRSGHVDLSRNGLDQLVGLLVELVDLQEIRAIGVNFETVMDAPDDEAAGAFIARQLASERIRSLPFTSPLSGLGARLQFGNTGERTSIIRVEPRFNDLESSEIFVGINTNSDQTNVPTVSEIADLYNESLQLITSFVEQSGLTDGSAGATAFPAR